MNSNDKAINTALNHMANASAEMYFDRNGVAIAGQAISFLQQCFRDDGWKNLGNLSQFENFVEEIGFKVVQGKNHRGGNCRIVTF